MRKILVTGGGGYIGSVLVKNLLKENFKVKVLDRFIFGGEGLLSVANDTNLQILNGDIRDKKKVKESVRGMDAVIHLAALVGEKACEENPKASVEINQKAVEELVRQTQNLGVSRFIFISTCSNYGISKEKEAKEESKLNPLSLYAETKIASEKFVLSKNSDNLSTTVLRLATIFGLSSKMRFNLIVNELARETALSGKFEIRDKNAWRPFLHVEDASAAIISVLESPKEKISGQIFNVVSENVTKGYLVDLAKKINPKIDIKISESSGDDKRDYRVSSKKIQKVLFWKPKITVEEGFIEVYRAVRDKLFLNPYEFKYNGWFDKRVFEDKYN